MSEVIEKEPSCLLVLSIRGEHMKNVTDSFIFLGHWPFARSFGFNTDILATNLINLIVVIGVLVFFGKGVCASCLFQEKVGFIRLHFVSLRKKKKKTINT